MNLHSCISRRSQAVKASKHCFPGQKSQNALGVKSNMTLCSFFLVSYMRETVFSKPDKPLTTFARFHKVVHVERYTQHQNFICNGILKR